MFAKVFSQILDSSIVEKPELRFTFMDMLILADQNGIVDMTHEAIARRTNRPVATIRRTIAELEQPDERSRTPDYKGARIKRLDEHRDWGWMIINYEFFRQLASEEQRRQKTLARVHKYREAKAEEEAEGEAFQKSTERFTSVSPLIPFTSDMLPPPINTPECRDAWDEWQEHYKQRKKTPLTERAARHQVKLLREMGPKRAVAAIRHSITNNWPSIWEPKEKDKAKQPAVKNKQDWSKITEENAI